MQQILSIPFTAILSMTILSGLLIQEPQIDNMVAIMNDLKPVIASSIKDNELLNGATPNIDTNWFSGSSSVKSEQPSSQTRNDKDNERIAQGRVVGESFGKDRPFI